MSMICNLCAIFEPIVAIKGAGHWKKKSDRCELCHKKLNGDDYHARKDND